MSSRIETFGWSFRDRPEEGRVPIGIQHTEAFWTIFTSPGADQVLGTADDPAPFYFGRYFQPGQPGRCKFSVKRTRGYTDGVGVLTLNRPEKRNAMTFAMLGEFIATLAAAGADETIRVLVITGTGGAFCAGTDLSDLSSVPGEQRGLRGSAEDGRISKADLLAFIGAPAPTTQALSPAVRKLVSDENLDPALIPATGPGGRLTKEDVLDFMEGKAPAIPATPTPLIAPAPSSAPSAPAAPPATPGAPPPSAGPREERVRMPKLRQTIARRLKEAQNTAAMLTTFNEADMSAVMALRAHYRDSFEKKHGVRLGLTSFFAKAVVAALKELPAVNAEIDGDEMVYKHYYDIGMAVSAPSGLVVPVIRDCDTKSFAEIESALVDLATRARDGKLGLDEMTGGTFTITNGGVFGSLLSTPILNMPQSGILGLHKIQQRPMAVEGEVKIRPMMYLALSYDHRIIDGREAVTFLVRVKDFIEDPERLLLDI